VHLAHPEHQRLVHGRAERELVDEAAEHADDADGSALAAGHDRLAYGGGPVGLQPGRLLDPVVDVHGPVAVCLHANGLDAGVGTASGGHLPQRFQHVDRGVVQRLDAEPVGGGREPVGEPVDHDDAFGAEHLRGPGRHLAHPAGSPDRDHLAAGQAAEVGGHPPGRHGVGGEDRGRVRHALGHRKGAHIGERDPDVLGVAAGEATGGV
jgi:hypothetical protein